MKELITFPHPPISILYWVCSVHTLMITFACVLEVWKHCVCLYINCYSGTIQPACERYVGSLSSPFSQVKKRWMPVFVGSVPWTAWPTLLAIYFSRRGHPDKYLFSYDKIKKTICVTWYFLVHLLIVEFFYFIFLFGQWLHHLLVHLLIVEFLYFILLFGQKLHHFLMQTVQHKIIKNWKLSCKKND